MQFTGTADSYLGQLTSVLSALDRTELENGISQIR